MLNLMTATISETTKKVIYSVKSVYLQMANVFGFGNKIDNIDMLSPYGDGCVPPKGFSGVVAPVNGSGKKLYFLGGVNAIPDIPHDPAIGESWKSSLKYVLIQQNDAVRAYRIGDEEFNATLPNGESFVEMMVNRINELQTNIDYLTNLVSQLQNHTHQILNVQGGMETKNSQPPIQTFSNPPTPSTLQKDEDYLTTGKALIDDLGKVYE